MSQAQLREHRGYLADERKIAAYRAALREVVRDGDVVLDLGTGTGLLGYLACEAGAGSVVAVDRGDIIGAAREIAAANGLAERITHLHGDSTDIELDPPADVAVCDQIGGIVYDAGILNFYADARRRLLRPGAPLVPASFRILLAPVTFEAGRAAVDFWRSAPAELDVSPVHARAVNTEWYYQVAPGDAVPLAPPATLASFAADHAGPVRGTAEFSVVEPGRFDGFLGWFDAQLSPSVSLTNDPWSPDRFDRWCNFYAVDLEGGTTVAAGDRIRLELDVRPRMELVTWATELEHDGQPPRRVRQSTLNSRFLTSQTLESLARDRPVAGGRRHDLARHVLGLVDGQRSLADILAALDGRADGLFASERDLETFVRRVLVLGGTGGGG